MEQSSQKPKELIPLEKGLLEKCRAAAESVHLKFIKGLYTFYGLNKPPKPSNIVLHESFGLGGAHHINGKGKATIVLGGSDDLKDFQGKSRSGWSLTENGIIRTIEFQCLHESGHYLHHRSLESRYPEMDEVELGSCLNRGFHELIAELGTQIFIEETGQLERYLEATTVYGWIAPPIVKDVKRKKNLLKKLSKEIDLTKVYAILNNNGVRGSRSLIHKLVEH